VQLTHAAPATKLLNPLNDPLFQDIINEENNVRNSETTSHRMQQELRRAKDGEALNGKGELKDVGVVKEVVDPDNSPSGKVAGDYPKDNDTRDTRDTNMQPLLDNYKCHSHPMSVNGQIQ